MTAAQAQTMQVGAWLAAIVSSIVGIIVNRAKLGKFLRRWWKVLAVVFGAAGLYVCYLRGWMDCIGDFSRWLSHPVAVPVWVYFSIVIVALGASTLVWFSIPFLKKLRGAKGRTQAAPNRSEGITMHRAIVADTFKNRNAVNTRLDLCRRKQAAGHYWSIVAYIKRA